jgi:cytochrome b6-f complex iron-sulfur subunit
MASDSSGKKLTTAEILARARAEKSAKGSETAPPAAEAAPPAPKPAAAPQVAAKPAAPASTGKPKTTAEILAAARAAKGGGATPAAEPAVEAPAPQPAAAKPAAAAGAKPKSTAEILAAARAAKGGGAEAAPAAPATAKPAAAKPAAGGAPKSTADILAAARAGKATAAAPAAAAKPAAAKPVAAKPVAQGAAAAVPADGPKLSVEEMLAAVRPAAAPAEPKATPVAVAAPKVAPPAPVRPSAKPAGKGAAAGETRRGFLGTVAATLASPFVIAWTALTASASFAGLGLARFMLPNVLTEPPSKFKIGPPTDYDLGTVATKWVAQFGIWIVHTDQYRGQNLIYALASVCTHLGCTPSWLEGERKFKCPCHGSGFYVTGINFEGPAPRPLERVGIRLAEDGMLEVDKSVKFQEEMGQWNDPSSFFEVTA